MTRPIDADKLLEKQFFSLDDDGFGMMVVSVTDIISAPTVEHPLATDNNVLSKWIPTAECLPDKATDYICRCIIGGDNSYPFYMILRYYLLDANPHFQHEHYEGMTVTHWMPLPKPPGEEQKDEPLRWQDDGPDYLCPQCKTRFSDEIVFINKSDDYGLPKFCPNCGVRLEG